MKIPKITNVSIRQVEGLPRLKAYATITLNHCILIKDIKIIKTIANRYRIAFPKESCHSPETIVLLDSRVRDYFEYVILSEFFKEGDEEK